MNSKQVGTLLGVAGVVFWFMPLVSFAERNMYQAGNHIGGIAYLMLFASLSYAVLSWMGLHAPRIIAGLVALAISLLFLAQAGSQAAWGLYGIVGASGAGVALASRDKTDPVDGRTWGAALGVAGMLLWFMPLINFLSLNMHQSGVHIGGIAYLLLFASLAYAVLSWLGQHVPRMIAGSVALAICLLFLVQVGESAAWGLIALILVSAISIVLAVRDNKISKAQASQA